MTPQEELAALRRLAELEAKAGQPQAPQSDPSFLEQVKNAAYGFAARGNEAMTAINPMATADDIARINAEQEWVKQHPGAGAGETLADIAVTLPAGGLSGAIPRILATAYTEAATKPGSLAERGKEGLLSGIGAGMGEGAASALGFLAKPFKKSGTAIDNVTDALREKAKSIGINLNAAQETGNKTLQAVDKQLSVIPSSSEFQRAQKEAQRLAWQRALFKQGGENADMATTDVMGGMKDRISGIYKDVGERNQINVDQQLKDALDSLAAQRNLDRMDVNKRGIVQSYLDEFNVPVGSQFSGSGYQNTRSILDKQADSMMNSNPLEAMTLKDIRGAMDDAMQRSVSPNDADLFRKANNDWAVMRSIEKAIDPETHTIKPNILLNHLARRDANRVIYGRGDQELAELARVGKAFIPDKAPDSGTAINSAIIQALTGGGIASGVAGTDYALSHDPVQAGSLGVLSLAASILGPKAAAKAMWKPGGYLSEGLVDMSKQVIPGVTRQRLLADALRNFGNQTAVE